MTTLNNTTFAAAVSATAGRVKLTSASNVAVGDILYAEGEGMLVQGLSGVYADVWRGWAGFARAHASGAVVWSGPAARYYQHDPVGAAPVDELYTPHINLQNGNMFVIVGGQWVQIVKDGVPVADPAGSKTTYTDAGAITLVPGLHLISGSAAIAMTLAAPGPMTPEGSLLHLVAGTAQAHTVTYTAGFAANTTSSDVATYGGAIGDEMVIQNVGGAWRIVALRNVTIA